MNRCRSLLFTALLAIGPAAAVEFPDVMTAPAPPATGATGTPAVPAATWVDRDGGGTPWLDREIDAARLPRDDDLRVAEEADSHGAPRVLRIEGRANALTQGATRQYENGLQIGARIDTPTLGAWSLDAALRSRPDRDGVFTLSQRGVPLAGGWRLNSSQGMLSTPAIDLTRTQSRFFLPAIGLAGVGIETLRGDGVQLNAAAGQPGTFTALSAPGFRQLAGQVRTAGLQWQPAPDWQAGLQRIASRGLHASDPDSQFATGGGIPPAPGSPAGPGASHATFASLAHHAGNLNLQGNLLASQAAGVAANGVWLDGQWREARGTQAFGVFRLAPGLAWAHLPTASDAQGYYFRIHRLQPRWSWDAGLDSVRPVSDGPERTGSTQQLTGSSRYQFDSRSSGGGGLTVRGGAASAWAAFGFVEHRGELGISRGQADTWSDDSRAGRHGSQLELDHAWTMPVGQRLSTSLAAGQTRSPAGSGQYTSAALNGGLDLSERLRLDASVRLRNDRGMQARTTLNAGFGVVHQLRRNWTLAANYFETRGWEDQLPGLAPLVPLPPAPSTLAPARALFLILRFEERAGTPSVPLGGAPGDGAGTIAGELFLDANENGVRDAGEGVAANVTVLLDGKFATRTDARGRFEFPLVAAGRHALIVVPDNLPLPWTMARHARQEVQVEVRSTARVALGATRLR